MPTDSEILRWQQGRTGFRLVPFEDWRALLKTGANVLVTGPEGALTAFVKAARAELTAPIVTVGSPDPLQFDAARTVILTDVHTCSAERQQELKRWMNEAGRLRAQVLSLTTEPLLPLVNAHRFDAELYYRLNTIHFEIRGM